MQAMRVALAFRRPDVDAFLDEIEHEQYHEWCNFLSLEPGGWQAMRILITRLGYLVAQSHSTRRLKESAFDVKIGKDIRSPAAERAQYEAKSIRQQLAKTRR